MIGRLNGILLLKQPPVLLVDVHGVGYELEAPMSTFYALPACGEGVILHTQGIVREDAQLLYGFFTLAERHLFRILLKVSGIGPRLALAILSGMSVDQFIACIAMKDVAALQRLPGIGKKTAERLLIELADRLKSITGVESSSIPAIPTGGAMNTGEAALNEAVSALVALGYKPAEAYQMVRQVNTGSAMGSETLIREALRATLKTGF